MKALLHVHSTYSYDGENTLPQLAAWGRARGLDAILLSEHVNDFDEGKMRRLVDECDALGGAGARLVPGLEFAIRGGFHLLGYGVRRFRPVTDPLEAVRFIREEGGLAVLAHPARYRGAWPPADALAAMNGIEAWNARYDGRFLPSGRVLSDYLDRCANREDLRPFGGQDLHAVTSNRLVVTEAARARTVEEFFEELRHGRAEFGERPFRVSMSRRPGRIQVGSARGLHEIYRLMRKLRDRIARRRPAPPAEES